MPPPPWETKEIRLAPYAIAPDGSEVRVLCATGHGSTALFTLPPRAVAKAVTHRTVAEIWYVMRGCGCIWRKAGEQEEIIELRPGVSLTIPTGVAFQFCNDGDEPLDVLGATMPPWPGDDEAFPVEGYWPPTV